MIPTKERLAQRLHSFGLLELEAEARAGEFSDFENEKYAQPKATLVQLLSRAAVCDTDPYRRAAITVLIREVVNGQWDDTQEEFDAWWAREGKDLLK